MSKTLVIVESPKKARTIQQILGTDAYQVLASGGHICDLPVDELGVDTDTFELSYKLTDRGKQSFTRIKAAAAHAREVILATDPDREGEAIAWHIAKLLRLKHPQRATFHAVTASAVTKALQSSGRINNALVDARQARRGSDRLIGYSVSRPLSMALNRRGLSTGRVQGAAVALLVEQERLIRAHISREHYSVILLFGSEDTQWEAKWAIPDELTEVTTLRGNALLNYERSSAMCLSLTHASAAAEAPYVIVESCERRAELRVPPPPLITSTLQQQAANRWAFDPEDTMKAAQSLFDAGHITYHRTDDPNVSLEGSTAIREYAHSQGLPVAAVPNRWPSPPGAQEGHEAIRPTDVFVEEAGDTDSERNLYRLIRLRAIQSQLAPAEYAVCEMTVTDEHGQYRYRANARELTGPGYLRFASLSGAGEPDNPDEEPPSAAGAVLPDVAPGTKIPVTDSEIHKHRTSQPRRYSIASLMRKLEVLGIGRPATYATIFATLFTRGYAEKAGKQLVPTTICEQIYDAVYPTFSYADLAYTRRMEEALDAIASGKMRPTDLMRDMYKTLSAELMRFAGNPPAAIASADTPPEPEKQCSKCGRPMRIVTGKWGRFWSCSGFGQNRACAHTEKVDATA